MVRGMQDGGVLATAKHFPGHGDTDSDSHLSLPSLSHSLGRLQSMELPPFEAAFAAGVSTVMVAHIYYPALEPEINLPASLSVNVITGLLRDGMDYDGLVMTDALDMDAIDTTYSPASASVRAVRAGVDLIAIGANIGPQAIARAMQAVVDAVRSGEIPEARIDESVRRILDAKARYGILDWQPLDASTASDRIDLGEHALLVDELFRAGVTLVYDHIDTIPLNPDRRITLIYPATRSSIRRACDDYDLSVNWLGVSASPTDIEIDWARSAATMSDVILVFTQNADQNPSQQALVRALPAGKVVVVALQSPYDWWRFPDVAGYLVTFSPIDSAFPAICDILFGTAPARGSLPISFAETVPAGTSAD
jgi:beta-N-acetylhexosaminidase